MSAIALPSSDISIHALRGEGDLPKTRTSAPTIPFQSTPSVGRATLSPCKIPCRTSISIHALRGEGDARRSYHGNDNYNFNPRPPWGGRLLGFFMRTRLKIFQSTPSVGRATQNKIIASFTRPKFQSTPSVGRATKRKQPNQSSTDISIHALRGEGDRYAQPLKTICPVISIHALRGEGDIDTVLISVHFIVISIHALRGEGDRILPNSSTKARHFNPRPPWGGRQRKKRALRPR